LSIRRQLAKSQSLLRLSSLALTERERSRLRETPLDGYRYLPIELFATERGRYVFDARNVCFLEVDPVAFDVLGILRERPATLDELVALLPRHDAESIRAAYADLLESQEEGLLTPYRFERLSKYTDADYETILSRRMAGFTVFITTKCNLGCSYCIYGGQYDQHEELSQRAMPWETLKATMDFLAAHSEDSKEVRLDFFGGEPLLAFPAIDRGVRYLKSILNGQTVTVTITSNGTILTDRILDFLLEHDVYLQFSVDGGRESHDRFRPIKGANLGSYDIILNNLQRIYDRDPDYFRRQMRLKGVLTTESVEADDHEFFSHPLVKIIIDSKNFVFLNLEPHHDLAKDADYFERVDRLGKRLIELHDLSSEADLLGNLNLKQRALYHHTLGRFFEAQVLNRVFFEGMDATPFTKGCLTGYQEGAVDADGNISICLKSAKGGNFVVGNVKEGNWYFDKMTELNRTFHYDWAGCSSCFLQKICDLCYEKLDGEEGEWVAGRARFCEFNRARHRVIFETMLRVTENNPALWDDLDRMIDNSTAGTPGEQQYGSQSLYSEQE
jgi:uncharacterized protein